MIGIGAAHRPPPHVGECNPNMRAVGVGLGIWGGVGGGGGGGGVGAAPLNGLCCVLTVVTVYRSFEGNA